ncbi:L-serine ammonia-lyase, iron-sulfur-dependent, subunit alpha [Shigella sonnei]|nr:L-serine ammonia-lyase, iron-sulfur-dependent, subunit alpha [Shigella sonnei]
MFDSTLNPLWQRYILAVQEEVKPALGCTEPISLALAAAVAAAELEGPVERVEAWVSPNLMKTMPVVVVAEHFGADDERLARALMLSHLSAIYIHNQLPRLSALCAATTAAMGAAAGMAWLVDGRYETISMAISSMIGDVSGMICDGASNSCAMKVSTSASAAWKAVLMALDDTAVTGNEGIVAHDVEQSIANLCALASHSMQQTDRQIIEIMASKAR